MEGRLTAPIIPKLIKPHTFRHLRPHKARVHNPHHNPLILQIQTQQFPHHIQRAFTSMVCVVASSFFRMAESDGAGFRGDEEDLGAGAEVVVGVERVDQEGGCDGGCCAVRC
jgi:hypothetical protein